MLVSSSLWPGELAQKSLRRVPPTKGLTDTEDKEGWETKWGERKNRDRNDSKSFGLSPERMKSPLPKMGKTVRTLRWRGGHQLVGICSFWDPYSVSTWGIKAALGLGVWSSGERTGCRHEFGRCQNIDCPSSVQKWLDFIQTKQSLCTC